MTVLIIIFAFVILSVGLMIVINSEVIFGLLRNNADKLELHILAVVVRLVLGLLLISQSGQSKYPLVIDIIGWLSIMAALSLVIIGQNKFGRLILWALSFEKPLSRVGGIFTILFATFLIHAFI